MIGAMARVEAYTAGNAGGVDDSFHIRDLNAGVPGELVQTCAETNHDDVITLGQAVRDCCADQEALWQAHQELRKEFAKVTELLALILPSASQVEGQRGCSSTSQPPSDLLPIVTNSEHLRESSVDPAGTISSSSIASRVPFYVNIDWHSTSYEFKESVWDAMAFVNLGAMHRSDEIAIMLVAVCNIAIQSLFVGLVHNSMIENVFTDSSIANYMRHWRVAYAHHPDFADPFTNAPLALDLCNKSPIMMHGAQQSMIYRELHDYVQDFLGLPSGGILCLLSVLLWILTCWKEMSLTLLCLRALCSSRARPNAGESSAFRKIDHVASAADGDMSFRIFLILISSRRALVLGIFVIVPRLWLLLSLGISGVTFLLSTTELTELILNAVALEVVLNVDELLFEVLAPEIVRKVVQRTTPIKVRNFPPQVHRVVPFVQIIMLTGLLIIITLVALAPLINTMNEVGHAMCSGDVEFLSFQLASGPVVVGVPTSTSIKQSGYVYNAILQRAGLEKQKNASQPLFYEGSPYVIEDGIVGGVSQARRWARQDIEDQTSVPVSEKDGMPCEDNGIPLNYPHTAGATWASLRYVTGNTSARTLMCTDVQIYCWKNNLAGKATRLTCPKTCGLTYPLSGQALQRIRDGAVHQCKLELQAALAIPKSRKVQNPPLCTSATSAAACRQLGCEWYGLTCQEQCYEATPNELSALTGWHRYVQSIAESLTGALYHNSMGNVTHVEMLSGVLKEGMRTKGCEYIAVPLRFYHLGHKMWTSMNLCDPDGQSAIGTRSARYFCPVTCKCTTNVKQFYAQSHINWTARIGLDTECWERCFD